MTKKIILPIAIIALIFLSSCLTSLHSLVTHTDVIADDRITGIWQYNDMQVKMESLPGSLFFRDILAPSVNKEKKNSVYKNNEDSLLYSNSYVFDFTREGYKYYMICCLTRIGNDIYADIEPAMALPEGEPSEKYMLELFSAGVYLPTHSIAKVVFRNNEVEFRFLNGDFIHEQLNNGRVAIRHETDQLFNTALITASAADLRSFIGKYGKDERLYSKENAVILKKILP